MLSNDLMAHSDGINFMKFNSPGSTTYSHKLMVKLDCQTKAKTKSQKTGKCNLVKEIRIDCND